LNGRQIPGVRVYATSFTPTESNFKGTHIEGVRFQIINREALDATRLGTELVAAIEKLYPGKVDFTLSKRIIGSNDIIQRLKLGEDPRNLQTLMQDDVESFVSKRAKYLLY
jgi:uncharacterized protein YbbC (DUF1343 family)